MNFSAFPQLPLSLEPQLSLYNLIVYLSHRDIIEKTYQIRLKSAAPPVLLNLKDLIPSSWRNRLNLQPLKGEINNVSHKNATSSSIFEHLDVLVAASKKAPLILPNVFRDIIDCLNHQIGADYIYNIFLDNTCIFDCLSPADLKYAVLVFLLSI